MKLDHIIVLPAKSASKFTGGFGLLFPHFKADKTPKIINMI